MMMDNRDVAKKNKFKFKKKYIFEKEIKLIKALKNARRKSNQKLKCLN